MAKVYFVSTSAHDADCPHQHPTQASAEACKAARQKKEPNETFRVIRIRQS